LRTVARRRQVIRNFRHDESPVEHRASRQEIRREVAGEAFGFSFFGFLISFF
jgi:hypothetical protein